MKNSYTLSNVYEIINKSEIELKENIVYYGEESWPITRNMLWLTLISLKKEDFQTKIENTLSYKKKFIDYKKYKKFLINSFRDINYKFSSKKFYEESKIIFFSNSVYLEQLSSGLLFDRIIDPIYMTSLINEKSIKIYLDNPILRSNFLFNGLNYFPNKYYFTQKLDPLEKANLEKSCMKFLKSFIKLNSLYDIEPILLINLKKTIKQYLISKKEAEQFLIQFTSLKKIFLVSWYFPKMMGIIASARKLGIASIEVQHGQQGKFHAGNSGWNVFPSNGFLNMPDNFWCWGENSIRNILESSPKRKFHKPILGGNAWPIWYKTFSKKRYFENLKLPEIRILFTMQGKQGETNIEIFPDMLLQLLKYHQDLYDKTNEKIFELKIRRHPNHLEENTKYLKERLGVFSDSNLLSFSSKLNNSLYDDLYWANFHITFYSSSALEALLFGIKSAVYGDEAYKIYEQEIKNKSITFLRHNSLDELLSWINKDINIGDKSYKDIFDIVFPNPELISSI